MHMGGGGGGGVQLLCSSVNLLFCFFLQASITWCSRIRTGPVHTSQTDLIIAMFMQDFPQHAIPLF